MSDPPDSKESLSFLEELKRRHVVRVLVVYAVVAFVVLQVAALTFEPLHLPKWAMTFVVVLAILGFLLAAVLAWAFETTPEGVRRTENGIPVGNQRRFFAFLSIVALLTIVGGTGLWVWSGDEQGVAATEAGTSPPPSTKRSIAVLPLDNLSPDPDDAYFSGAMTEEITSALSRVPGLRVVSRTSATKFAGSDASLPEIADQLGVRYVLEGSVRRSGDEAAIVVQLIDATTDEHVWTERYERSMKDVLGLQVEIARRIADELRSSFTAQERDRILAGSTDDPVAYDFYLRGTEIAAGGSPEDMEEGIRFFEEAVRRDPQFSDAWAELGFLYRFAAIRRGPAWADSSRMAMERAIQFAKEPSLAATYRARQAFLNGEDSETAIAAMKEALDANPGDPLLVADLAGLQWVNGNLVEAARYGLRARALDPLNASRWSHLGGLYRALGMDERAYRALHRALELDSNDEYAWAQLFDLHLVQGRYPEALAVQDSFAAVTDAPVPLGIRAIALLYLGEVEKARPLLERAFEERSWSSTFTLVPELAYSRLATGDSTGVDDLIRRTEETLSGLPTIVIFAYVSVQLAAVRGDAESATERLARYVELGGRDPRGVAVDPILERVRSDPRFQAEMEKLEEATDRDRRQVERMLDQEKDARP